MSEQSPLSAPCSELERRCQSGSADATKVMGHYCHNGWSWTIRVRMPLPFGAARSEYGASCQLPVTPVACFACTVVEEIQLWPRIRSNASRVSPFDGRSVGLRLSLTVSRVRRLSPITTVSIFSAGDASQHEPSETRHTLHPSIAVYVLKTEHSGLYS
jgi:hypothetical protein